MALQGITVLTLIGIVQIAVGQQSPFGWQGNPNPAAPMAGGIRGFPFGGGIFGRDPFFNDRNDFWGDVQETTVYTCIGKNTNGDQMRVTFRDEQRQNRWDRWTPQRLQMEAQVTVSGQSQTRGQFQLIATEYGRVEDGCIIRALGDIIGSNSMFRARRPNTEIGILGVPFALAPNQGHTSTTHIQGFANAEALNGHGLALCASRQINGGTCNGIIPLCCKIGRDAKRATELNRPNFGFGMNGQPNNLFAGSSAMQGGMQGGMPGALPGASSAGMPGAMPGGMAGSPGTGGLPGSTGNTGAGAPQFQALFGGT